MSPQVAKMQSWFVFLANKQDTFPPPVGTEAAKWTKQRAPWRNIINAAMPTPISTVCMERATSFFLFPPFSKKKSFEPSQTEAPTHVPSTRNNVQFVWVSHSLNVGPYKIIRLLSLVSPFSPLQVTMIEADYSPSSFLPFYTWARWRPYVGTHRQSKCQLI